MKKRFTAIILMLAFFTTGAFAANAYKKTIEVDQGIAVSFNGTVQSMTDAGGSTVQPFVYNGTTYVPIRAISGMYGSDIHYDSATKTAEIYDDFSEICAAVHQMNTVVTDCYLLVHSQIYNKEKTDYAAIQTDCDTAINTMYDTLSFLASDDGYNVNISIITDEIMPDYQAFILSFTNVQNAYKAYVKSSTSYTTNQFVDALHDALDKYYAARGAIDKFYTDYCLWRNI